MGFNGWQDFQNFEREVKFENRFVHSEAVQEFLSNLVSVRKRGVFRSVPETSATNSMLAHAHRLCFPAIDHVQR